MKSANNPKKKNMLIALLAVVVLGLVALLMAIAMQPEDFLITRSAQVGTPPPEVFARVNDFHQWELWSPWAKLDPTMKTSYGGPSSGKGALYSWSGNSKAGEGRMELVESQPPRRVLIRLDFLRPMRAVNMTEFSFEPEGAGTRVTWNMTGKKNFMQKAFHLFVNVDKLVGKDFEKGLQQLKSTVENSVR